MSTIPPKVLEILSMLTIVALRVIFPIIVAYFILKYLNKHLRKVEDKIGKQQYLTIASALINLSIIVLTISLIASQFEWVRKFNAAITGNGFISICIVTVLTAIGVTVLFYLTNTVMHQQEQRYGTQIHIKFLFNILKLFIILLAVATIGSQFKGFKSTIATILASSGILALGISMAAQESLANIIDGIFISMFKPFNIGDRITLPEKNSLTGTVKEMNLRHTVITTYNNTSFIVPNAIMSSAIVENSNFNMSFSYPIDVSVSYESDLDLAISLLEQAVTSHPKFVDTRTPDEIANNVPKAQVLVREFGASGIDLRCPMRVNTVAESFLACSDVRRTLKKLYDENGIVIPYTTIHIDNPTKQ